MCNGAVGENTAQVSAKITSLKWIAGGALMLLSGCAGGVSKQDAANFEGSLAQGNYTGAAQIALTSGQIAPDGKSKNLAWSLNAGAALLYDGETPRVVPVLDGAEALMKEQDLSRVGNSQYEYATYDGVMVNVYKALAFWGSGNKSDARVEFNRVGERQSRAEEEFAKQKAKLDADARKRAGNEFDLQAALNNAQNNASYKEAQAELGQYANYRPFINPAAGYLRALFLMNNAETASDLEAARVELNRVRDLVGASPVVQADLALIANGRKDKSPKVWIVFENGQAPTFSEYRITFPVPVVGKGGVKPGVVTVALPRMVFHAPAAQRLAVSTGKTETWSASIGDFDRVMATEFSRRQPAIMTRTVLEAALKTAMQTAAAQTGNGLVQLVALTASNISSADTRSWTALPKNFQAARIDAPTDGRVHLRTDSGLDLGDVQVPKDHSSLVYVKEVAPGAKPSLQVFPL